MTRPKQVQEIAWNRIGDQVVILGIHESDRSFHELNDTAATIWTLINGERTENEIAAQIAEQFDVDLPQALADTQTFLKELAEKRLIHFA